MVVITEGVAKRTGENVSRRCASRGIRVEHANHYLVLGGEVYGRAICNELSGYRRMRAGFRISLDCLVAEGPILVGRRSVLPVDDDWMGVGRRRRRPVAPALDTEAIGYTRRAVQKLRSKVGSVRALPRAGAGARPICGTNQGRNRIHTPIRPRKRLSSLLRFLGSVQLQAAFRPPRSIWR